MGFKPEEKDVVDEPFKKKHSRVAALLTTVIIVSMFAGAYAYAQEDRSDLEQEVKALKEQLSVAKGQISQLENKLSSLADQITAMKQSQEQIFKEASTSTPPCAIVPSLPACRTGSELKEENVQVMQADDTTEERRQAADKAYVLAKEITKGFEYQGYLRSGYGVNGKGGHQVAFMAPGAGAKYRFGNEVETYGELQFAKNFLSDPKGPYFKTEVLLAFQTDQNTNWDTDHDKFTVRQSYTEMGNFDWGKDLKFWAGQRFYQRHDVHINDFYFLNMSGYGGGVEDIGFIGPTKLDVAYIGGSSDNYDFPKIGHISKNSFDMRIHDIDVPYGEGTIWLAPSFLKGGDYVDGSGNDQEYPDAGGLAVGFLHTTDKVFDLEGYNKLCIQYGMGTGSDFSPNVQSPDTKVGNRRAVRITESGEFQLNEHFAMMYVAIYQMDDNGQDKNAYKHWVSSGVRPIYFYNKNIAFVLEPGVDYVKNESGGYEDVLFKISGGPELRFDNSFFGRPVLRAYVTYAVWGSGFRGMVGGEPYINDTSGLAAGVQMEAWW